jgi:GT2 family glycosyltransferase
MKTLIAIPCMDQVPAHFAQSLAMLRKVGDCAVAFQVGSLVYTSRNNLSIQALNMNAEYILWLDSDMVFQPDLLERMFKVMEENKLDFLSGLYFRRAKPFTPVIFDKLEMREDGCHWHNMESVPTELTEIEGCGFGVVLMKSEIIANVFGSQGDLFTPLMGVGEDLSFCWRARQAGYKLYLDPSISLGHVGNFVFNEEFYRSYSEAQNGTS